MENYIIFLWLLFKLNIIFQILLSLLGSYNISTSPNDFVRNQGFNPMQLKECAVGSQEMKVFSLMPVITH